VNRDLHALADLRPDLHWAPCGANGIVAQIDDWTIWVGECIPSGWHCHVDHDGHSQRGSFATTPVGALQGALAPIRQRAAELAALCGCELTPLDP
jgi:hypothetical protein